jgi:UDP-3-O-[3-hydroxymyristoyl] glucosamine N-acyltransferase
MNSQDSIEPEPRSYRLSEIARIISGEISGNDDLLITGVSDVEEAEEGDIVFAENDRFLRQAINSRASAIVAPLNTPDTNKAMIRVMAPRRAFISIIELFADAPRKPAGVHPSALISPTARIGQGVCIGPNVVIEDDVVIKDGSVIMANCFIGYGCTINEDCMFYPNVTLYHGVRIGKRVILHSGAVIGADGFGYMFIDDQHRKIPQIGGVIIGDDVEIGCNTTVDRAKTGMTVVGNGTKIDNLVQVGHNCKIGPNCILIAQTGLAGSVQLGQGVILGGQTGLKDHVRIGDGAIVMAQAGVFGDIPPQAVVSGYPARPHRQRLRQEAAYENLPELAKRVKSLEKLITELQQRIEDRQEEA